MIKNKVKMDIFGIDSHKLNLHPQRVAKWLDGDNIYPIYMEISPAGACNHRCIFCTMDFMGYKSKFLDTVIMKKRIQEFGKLGVKAIMFAGEGEPLLHKDICELAETTKNAGIDVSFTTNAVLLNEKKIVRLLPVSSWIKVSCNAGNPEDYNKVMHNMEYAVNLRKKENYSCTLGFQCILLPESQDSMIEHARRVRNLGADYLVIKPYTHHPQSLKEERKLTYEYSDELALALKALETDTFKVIYRNNTMQRWNTKAVNFNICHALPFWSFIDSDANVCGCSRHLQEDNFNYGNLYKQSFAELWNDVKRKQNMDWCNKNLDINQCHLTCRMEAINIYLHRLKNPLAHDNFI